MNTNQILNLVTKHSDNFGGVFPADGLNFLKNDRLYILNTDPSQKKGQHWVAMYVNNDLCEFFDSFGKPPIYYHQYWHEYLIAKSKKYIYNKSKLQKYSSEDCGKFCIFYVVLRSKGIHFENIIELVGKTDLNSFLASLDLDKKCC